MAGIILKGYVRIVFIKLVTLEEQQRRSPTTQALLVQF